MSRIFPNSIEEVVTKRKSVRTYNDEPLKKEDQDKILEFMASLSNPFGKKVMFSFLETGEKSKALGTYGIIKGTVNYIGAAVKDEPLALEALGYEMEKLMLFCANSDIGTCWLGGTFKREDFKKAMNIEEGYLFPAVTPVGYPKAAKSLADNLVRFIAKGDMRKKTEELFFDQVFDNPLSFENLIEYERVLEMVRLAPSASNKQPWRILYKDGSFHFYEAKTPGYSDTFPYDIQKIDMGIAACHFELTAMEKELPGKFEVLEKVEAETPDNFIYSFSWIRA